jgi:transcriptional regulator with XRE-family HTH domain
MIDHDIGRRIQKAREEAGLSQDELASMIGITQSALSNYELGKRRLYLANLQEIAKRLNRPLTCFLDVEGQELDAADGPAEGVDDTTREIMRLLPQVPELEREFLLDYVKWMIDRKK